MRLSNGNFPYMFLQRISQSSLSLKSIASSLILPFYWLLSKSSFNAFSLTRSTLVSSSDVVVHVVLHELLQFCLDHTSSVWIRIPTIRTIYEVWLELAVDDNRHDSTTFVQGNYKTHPKKEAATLPPDYWGGERVSGKKPQIPLCYSYIYILVTYDFINKQIWQYKQG